MAVIKRITSRSELLKQLKKHNLIFSVRDYHISDKHSRPVNRNVAEYFLGLNVLESTKAMSLWFESEWRLKFEFRKAKDMKEISSIMEGLASENHRNET